LTTWAAAQADEKASRSEDDLAVITTLTKCVQIHLISKCHGTHIEKH